MLQHNTIEAVLERGEKLDDTVVIMMLLCVAAQHNRSCSGAGGEAGRPGGQERGALPPVQGLLQDGQEDQLLLRHHLGLN